MNCEGEPSLASMARLAYDLGCRDADEFVQRGLVACGGKVNPSQLRHAWLQMMRDLLPQAIRP